MKTKTAETRLTPVLVFLILLAGALAVGLLLRRFTPESPRAARRVRTQPEGQFPRFEERWMYGQGTVKVVHLRIEGPIGRERPTALLRRPPDMTTAVLLRIRAARNDRKVRAILLEVNSGGGALTPCDEIYHALLDFRRSREDRRLFVYARDMAASGAYLIAMAGDQVMSSPTALIGSIGVMLQTLNWNELSDRIGVRDVTIKSGRHKDQLNPFREMSEEEFRMLQDLVDEHYERFLGIVARARGLEIDQVRPWADGRILTASRALETGLIDSVGHWDDALRAAAQLVDEEDIRLVQYEETLTLWPWLLGARIPSLPAWWSPDLSPRLVSLWKP